MAHMGVVNWSVFAALVIMSMVAWYYTIMKAIKYARINGRAGAVTAAFWQTSNAQEAIRFMEEQPANEPFSKIALDCATAAAHHQKNEGSRLAETLSRSEFIDRALRQAVTRESSKLENGMTILATTGSAAPFIGLLGTTWGIYKALIKIGASGSASLDAVAGPVGEALLKTALGLVVAIPAVMAYNFFNRMNRTTNAAFDAFAHDLHDFFATGSRVGEGASKR
jgi:biopolymer transport protein ExbB